MEVKGKERVVADRSSVGFLQRVESTIFRTGRNPGNPLRPIGRQLYSRRERAGKALLLKGLEILKGVPSRTG